MSDLTIDPEKNQVEFDVMGKKFKLSSYDPTFSKPSIHDDQFVTWTIYSKIRVEDEDYFKNIDHQSTLICRFRDEAEKIRLLSGHNEKYAHEISLNNEGMKTINEISAFIQEEVQSQDGRSDQQSLNLEIFDRQADILYFCQYEAVQPYVKHLSKETTELFLQTASPDEKDEALLELAKIGSKDCVDRFLQAGVEVPLETLQQSHDDTRDLLRAHYEHRLLKTHLALNPPTENPTQQQSHRRRL